MVSDDEFEAELARESLIRKYRESIRRINEAVKREYSENIEQRRKLKLAGIETERAHRDLLNMCVYPFTETQRGCTELGYRFLRGSPLAEMNLVNFDFLVARLVPSEKPIMLIAGEGRTSVGSPRGIVNELARKETVLRENLDYILKNYLGQKGERETIIEVVIAVDSTESNTMLDAVVEAQTEVKVWHGPLSGPEILRLAVPPKSIPNQSRHLHKDQALDQLLTKGLQTIRRTFDVWPNTHTLIKLGALITAAHPSGSGMAIRQGALESCLGDDMFYLTEDERKAEAQRLIKIGIELGFLDSGGILGEYRVVSKGVRRDSLEETLTGKWLRRQLDKEVEAAIQKQKDQSQDELRAERARIKTIYDY